MSGDDSVRRPPKLHRPQSLRGLVAAGLTVACLIYLAMSAQLPSLGEATRRADYRLLGLAILLSLLTIICKAARWRALYPAHRMPRLSLAVAAIAVGQVANWAAPVRLGELVRVGLVTSEGSQEIDTGRGAALGAGVLGAEKILDGMMLLLAAALLSAVGGLPGWVSALGLVLVASACIGGIALAWVLRRHPMERWLPRRLSQLMVSLLPGRVLSLSQYLRSVGEGMYAWLSPGIAIQVILWSIGAWGLGGVINYVVLKSLDIDQGLGATLAVLVVLYGGTSVPSLPGRVGVFQYLCVLALTPFGVEFDRAFAFSLALYVIIYLPPIVLGLLSVVLVGPSEVRSVMSGVGRGSRSTA